MNSEEIKLTKYLHNIIENNMSLRNENDRLWKQKLEYIDRIDKARKYLKDREEDNECCSVCSVMSDRLLEILKGEKE